MQASKRCCVPCCNYDGDTPPVLHGFPNPEKDRERFNTWLYAIGGDILALDNERIFKYRRVCRSHFAEKYLCRNNKISSIAVPTLNMTEPLSSTMHRLMQRGLLCSTPWPNARRYRTMKRKNTESGQGVVPNKKSIDEDEMSAPLLFQDCVQESSDSDDCQLPAPDPESEASTIVQRPQYTYLSKTIKMTNLRKENHVSDDDDDDDDPC